MQDKRYKFIFNWAAGCTVRQCEAGGRVVGVAFVQPKVLMAANKAGRGDRSERRSRRAEKERRQQRREMTLTSAIKTEKQN